jgi:hypothetical protein
MYCTSELFADGEKFLSEKDLPSCQNSSQLSSLWPMDRKLEITLTSKNNCRAKSNYSYFTFNQM